MATDEYLVIPPTQRPRQSLSWRGLVFVEAYSELHPLLHRPTL
jgi:hypothetical protein